MHRLDARLLRRADPVLVALGVLVLAAVAFLGLDAAPRATQVPAFWFFLLLPQACLAVLGRRVAALTVARPGADKSERGRIRAARLLWRLWALAGVALAAGDIWQVVAAARHPDDPASLNGTTVELVCVGVTMVLAVGGLLRYPLGAMSARARSRLRLDAGTVLAAATTFGLWLVELPPGRHTAGWVVDLVATLLVEPGLLLVAVFGVVKVVLAGRAPFCRATGILVGLGGALHAVLQAVPDTAYEAHIHALPAANVVASTLLAIGFRVQERQARADPAGLGVVPRRPYSVLPYAAMGAAWALVLYVLATDGLYWRGWVVVVGAMATTALVAARQLAAFRHIAELLRERNAMAAQLHDLAYRDSLTGLGNRGLFLQQLGTALAAGPVTVFLIDLDEFKPVNDRYGHAAGDRLLVEVGARLRGCVRASDTVARLGGDEFAVLLADADQAGGTAVGRSLAAALTGQVRIGEVDVPLRASIGMATGDGDPDSVLHAADMAMYAAKGRKRSPGSAPDTDGGGGESHGHVAGYVTRDGDLNTPARW